MIKQTTREAPELFTRGSEVYFSNRVVVEKYFIKPIRYKCCLLNLNQKELSTASGVSARTISDIMYGEYYYLPDRLILIKLAQALNITNAYFLIPIIRLFQVELI